MRFGAGHISLMLAMALAGAAAGAAGRQTPYASITVFAASDLGPAFKQLVPQYERTTGSNVTVVPGSTGTLTQQIRNGAPADVFFAANEAYIQQLSAERLTIESTRTVYARGLIATVTLKSSAVRVEELNDLEKPEIRRIAIANPTHAPYGLAARQALEATGLWKKVATKLVYGENVQQAAQFVRSGSVEAAIVARSVADMPDLRWKLIDQRFYAPLDQMAVVLARTKQPAASTAFIEFVNGIQGRVVMRQFGFLLPGESF
jgi:molybdate transport system substrate-binding protein